MVFTYQATPILYHISIVFSTFPEQFTKIILTMMSGVLWQELGRYNSISFELPASGTIALSNILHAQTGYTQLIFFIFSSRFTKPLHFLV